MKKILIAIDGSTCAMRAVEYVARQFGTAGDVEIGLVHVLPNLPAIFWDEGHILSDDEKRDRKKVVEKWIADREAAMAPVFKKAADILGAQGIKRGVRTKSISDSTDIAESILEEAKDEGYGTIVVGRCGNSAGKRILLGSITNRIVAHAAGVAVTVVE